MGVIDVDEGEPAVCEITLVAWKIVGEGRSLNFSAPVVKIRM